jgi:hypothetical protein
MQGDAAAFEADWDEKTEDRNEQDTRQKARAAPREAEAVVCRIAPRQTILAEAMETVSKGAEALPKKVFGEGGS